MSRQITANKNPSLSIAYLAVDVLIPYAQNSRTHSDDQVDLIANSIREFGFTNPILIDGERGIIAGHGRLMAAEKLGMVDVPTIELTGLSEAQRRAYVIADNQLALRAGWNMELLASELHGLDAEGFGLGLMGFEPHAIDDLMATADEEGEPEGGGNGGAGSLANRFGIPPFSVLNAREGWWQDRKRAWLALGIKSELGRGEELIPDGGGNASKARYAGRGKPLPEAR